MADLPDTVSDYGPVYLIGENDPAVGGLDGIDNRQARALMARDNWLRDSVDGVRATTDQLIVLQGAALDGVTDDTVAFHRFLDKIVETGAIGLAPNGGKLKVTSTYNRTLLPGQSFRVDLSGVEVLQGGNNGILNIRNSGSPLAVTSTETVSYNLGNGAANSVVTKIAATGHTFSVGDIGKIISDDVVRFFENGNQRRGEFFVVAAVEPGIIYTTGTLRDTYTTGIQVVKPSDAKVEISNMTVRSAIADAVTASAVTVSGLVRPTLSHLSFEDMNATALNITGCYQALVAFPVGNYLKNRPDLGAYGYLVNDSSSFMTLVLGLRCSYARHAYTTTVGSTAAGDGNWFNRGMTIDSKVANGAAQGCGAAFDTHAPALGIEFFACDDLGDFRGNDVGGASFQIRGQDCKVTKGRSRNAKIGVSVLGAYATENQRCEIDVEYSGPSGCVPVQFNNGSAFKQSAILRGVLDSENPLIIDARKADVRVKSLDCRARFQSNGGTVVSLTAGATVVFESGVIDLTDAGGIQHSVVTHGDVDTAADVRGLSIVGNGTKLLYLAVADANDVRSRWHDLSIEDSLPGIAFKTSITLTQSSVSYRNAANQHPLKYRATAYGTSGAKSVDLQYSGHDSITARLDASVSGVSINNITKGAFSGQELNLAVRSTSANPVTLSAASSGNIAIAASIAIAPGNGVRLFYDGTNWQCGIQ